MASEQVAQEASVRGQVQGVGFRANTTEQARQLGVTGWVRNESDGSVTIHAEGEPQAVNDLLSWAHDGPHFAEVDDVEVSDAEVEGHDGFGIDGGW